VERNGANIIMEFARVGTFTLLIAAMQKKDEKACAGIKINIDGAKDNVFH
jgi:hypothetical protein